MQDLIGQKFNRISVIELAPKRNGVVYYTCKCVCGKIWEVAGKHLLSGSTQSCGCLSREKRWNNYKLGDLRRLPDGEADLRYLFDLYKRNAKNRQYSFELTKEEFKNLVTGNCYYCGIQPLQKGHRYGELLYNGIDRIDNKLGYIKENCVSCCSIHNQMKMDMSMEDFINNIKSVYNYFILGKKL